jgi:hypothetical protein
VRRRDGDFEAIAQHDLPQLGDLQASNLAAERALKRPEISREDRAEIHALRDTTKAQWLGVERGPEERQRLL